jgi:hypothetical protein
VSKWITLGDWRKPACENTTCYLAVTYVFDQPLASSLLRTPSNDKNYLLVGSAAAQAQNLVDLYTLQNGSLADSVGSHPLVNNYGATTGPGFLNFGFGDGPALAVDPSLAGNYTIGLYFSLTNPEGINNPWVSIVNFSDLQSDANNQYLYGGQPTFFGQTSPSADTVSANTPALFFITRDGNSYNSYLNGVLENSFSTVANPAGTADVVGGLAVFQLFHDDNELGNVENSAGTLYGAAVWDAPLSQQQIEQFNQLVGISVPDQGSLTSVWLAVLGVMGWLGQRSRKG